MVVRLEGVKLYIISHIFSFSVTDVHIYVSENKTFVTVDICLVLLHRGGHSYVPGSLDVS